MHATKSQGVLLRGQLTLAWRRYRGAVALRIECQHALVEDMRTLDRAITVLGEQLGEPVPD